MSTIARYSFLSWAKRGIGARVTAVDPLDATNPPWPQRASVPVSLVVNEGPRIDRRLALYGPGDIVSLDARAVVRTDPRPDVTDFEPNYLASVEFYDEDLPWRYTPAAATPEHRLRPWIALVVLADGEFERVPRAKAIRVADAGNLFPSPTEVWAWAHVHVNADLGGDPTQLDAVVDANPDLAVARLLSPRRLRANTAYTAFVIPTFESGRFAGLGLDVPDDLDGAKPSWGAGQDQFPFYVEWSFRTGPAGDFESLIRLLEARALDPRVGLRDMDVQAPAPGLIAGITNPPSLGLEGALRSLQTVSTSWPRAGEAFPDRLTTLVNASISSTADPIVAPPLYGRWHAATSSMGSSNNPPWIEALNRDPRHRAAAGFGAEVIRRNQEQLMDAAWRQVGAVLEANRALSIAQLARMTARSVHTRHLSTLPGDQLVAITAPVHGRILGAAVTVREQVKRSAVPSAVFDHGFRRIARGTGPLARRFFGPSRRQSSLVVRLNARDLTASRTAAAPDQALVLDAITARASSVHARVATATMRPALAERHLTSHAIHAVPARPGFRLSTPGERVTPHSASGADSSEAARFRQALVGLHATLEATPAPPPKPMLELDAVRATLVTATDPAHSIASRVLSRFRTAGLDLGGRADPLETIMTAPQFDRPMYEPLAELSPELLLPNVGLVTQNTISLLQTNSQFVESYLVGLNHEMARELLWREYPTDQRGTYFRKFWDTRDSLGGAATYDIDAIHEWPRASALGDHVSGGAERLVLIIRGDVLKKYPTAVIYAVNATWPAGGGKRALGTNVKYPLFHGSIPSDITFLGFDLTVDEAKGSDDVGGSRPGWFFVIKERPGEPRFGLDEPSGAAAAATWDDLSWSHVAPGGSPDLSSTLINATMSDSARWGATAADMAWILYQDPVLIAVHASEMLP